MGSLLEVLGDEGRRAELVQACIDLIDSEVAAKSGLGGMAIKAGYKAVQGVKPGFTQEVVETLLPEFAGALDPLRDEAVSSGISASSFFERNSDRVADALLAITDLKAENAENAVIKGAYKKLRGSAKKNVASAAPGLGAIVERFA